MYYSYSYSERHGNPTRLKMGKNSCKNDELIPLSSLFSATGLYQVLPKRNNYVQRIKRIRLHCSYIIFMSKLLLHMFLQLSYNIQISLILYTFEHLKVKEYRENI